MKNIIITGPTCSGKTKAAVILAEKINGEIISADSRQIYRHMDIGTAKPSKEERARAPHHLIDILPPAERYSAADFRRDAEAKISEIKSRGGRPIIAGGTGLYIKALVDGIFTAPAADERLRSELEQKAADGGIESLHSELSRKDPAAAEKIHPRDKRRIIRALEIYKITGSPPSALKKWESSADAYAMFGLDMARSELYSAINERVLRMFREGLLEEVKKLLGMGCEKGLVSMETVGYREIIGHLEGRASLQETAERIMAGTRQYARRQLTWLRGDKRIKWLKVEKNTDWDFITEEIIQHAK